MVRAQEKASATSHGALRLWFLTLAAGFAVGRL